MRKLSKKSLLIENQIKFPENIHYEDSPFNTLSLLYSQSVCKIDEAFYNYLIREDSSSNCRNKERLYDRITSLEYMFSQVNLRGLYTKNKEIIDNKYVKMMSSNLNHICLNSFDEPNKEKLKVVSKDLCKNVPHYKNVEAYRYLDKQSKLNIELNNLSSTLLIIIDKLNKHKLVIKRKVYKLLKGN